MHAYDRVYKRNGTSIPVFCVSLCNSYTLYRHETESIEILFQNIEK